MRHITWIALAVFAVLAGTAFFVLNRKPERGITRISYATLDTNSVDRIEVLGPSPIVLTRADNTWRVPSGREADHGMVDQLLSNVQRIHSDDLYTQDSNRFEELEVNADKGHDVNLYAGKTKLGQFIVGKYVPGPAGSTAMRTGDTVYKVRDVFAFVFAHSPMEWTERHVATADANTVVRFNVRLHDDKPYTLTHKEKGFDLVSDEATLPKGYRFDINNGTQLVNSVLALQAQELLDKDPGVDVTKLDDTADSFTWFYNDAERERLKVPSRTLSLGASREDKQVYAKVEGHDGIFTLPETTAAGMRRSLGALRDLSMMSTDSGKVVSFSVDDNKAKYTLTREDTKSPWKVAKGKVPAGFAVDMPKLMKRIAMASHVRAIGVPKEGVSDAAMGLKKPSATITLTTEDDATATLKFGARAPDGWYAVGAFDSVPYVVGNYLHDQIMGGLDALKRTGPDNSGDPLAQLDPAALSNLPLEVRASLQQQMAQKRMQEQAAQRAK